MDLPPGRTDELVLGVNKSAAATMIGAPDCDGTPLASRTPTTWSAPAACRTLRWGLELRDQDKEGVNAADPTGAWSAQGRWWLLTDHLAFLAPRGGWEAEVAIEAHLRDGAVKTLVEPFPHRGQMPFYGVVAAAPARIYRSGAFTLRVHGAVPPEAGEVQQHFFADTWSRWRRDVLPRDAKSPATLDILWIAPPPHGDPGFMASAGMRAVLMQNIPGPDQAGSDAKLRAAVMLGVHEGFHTLIGSIPESWPMWVNESWASYFALLAAGPRLDPAARKEMDALINAPTAQSLLAIQAQVDHGDNSNYDAFYGKGARFWAAIDALLTTRRNPSGRLAALIQDTNGLQDLDWSKPDAIAAYFDARSGRRAGKIVRCYLIEANCG